MMTVVFPESIVAEKKTHEKDAQARAITALFQAAFYICGQTEWNEDNDNAKANTSVSAGVNQVRECKMKFEYFMFVHYRNKLEELKCISFRGKQLYCHCSHALS